MTGMTRGISLPQTTIHVATASQLAQAFKAVRGGETILLASANFGDVALSNVRPASLVTIKSADPLNDAVFKTLKLTNVANVLVEDIDVNNPIAAGTPRAQAVAINKAVNVTLRGLDVAGSLDGDTANDAHGIVVTGSDNVSILDSTFRQLHAAIVLGRNSDVVVAGNAITEAREGVNIGQQDGGLFERNFVTKLLPLPGDHPDAFQVHNGNGIGASNDLAFRNNVIIQGNERPIHGIYVNSERDGEGIHHSNISVENNFYRGSARHGVSLHHVDNAVIESNTVLYSGTGGLVPAVLVGDIQGGRIKNNIATLLLENKNTGTTNLTSANNVDVWDPKFKVGISEAALFAPTTPGDMDFSRLAPLGGSAASGLGFHASGEIGGFDGSTSALMAAYVPQFEASFATVFMV